MEQEGIDDAKFEAMLDHLRVSEPDLLCDSGHKIEKICCNPKCKVALMCGEPHCKNCGIGIHPICSTLSLAGLAYLLNDRVSKYKEFISKALELDNELIEAIKESKKELTAEYCVSSLSPDIQRVVDLIFKEKSSKSVSGSEGKLLSDKMQELSSRSSDRTVQLLQEYRQAIFKMAKQVDDLKKGLYQGYREQFSLDSLVLRSGDANYQSQAQFLREALGNPEKLELLYRGSENDFNAGVFHQRCDNIEGTLTLVSTQFGKKIAGFTPYAWNSIPNGSYLNNPAGGSFLLSLDSREKLVPTDTNYLIYHRADFGPTFGGGHDLYISHCCNSNTGSYANFSYSYNTADNKYKNDQTAFTALSGCPSGFNFRVVEYEVFRVVKRTNQ